VSRPRKSSGACIVCGHTTADGSRSGGRWHWRCADGEECAVRRNRRKKRPQPEVQIRAEWRRRHARTPVTPNPNPHLKSNAIPIAERDTP
jgi:hypothetical protein